MYQSGRIVFPCNVRQRPDIAFDRPGLQIVFFCDHSIDLLVNSLDTIRLFEDDFVQKSDAERHLHGVLATLSRCKATSQGNSSIMVTRTIYVRLIIIHGGKKGIEYHEDRKLDKAQMLRFATCQYIDEGHHIILKGASGNGKTYIACALGNAACRRFKKVQYIRMPELLDELSIARSAGTLKKVLESYKKKDLLILDEWLIRPLSPQESYDMLEIVEARCRKSMIFCTQYESEGWYTRIDPNPESDSPVSEAIMDRIIHNAYEVLVDGRVSMRERKGLKAAREGGGQDT